MTQNLPFIPRFHFTQHPHRHRTPEFVHEHGIPKGWYQDGRRLRHVKTAKAFVWPKDGRNSSTWGRLMDVVTNKGPDMFVAFGARKADCLSNGPTREQWSGHTTLGDWGTTRELKPQRFAPWTTKGILGGRTPNLRYDFRSRRYCAPHEEMWTDAIWQPDPYKNRKWNSYPEAMRNIRGHWFQDHQYLPQFRGGPISNEYGQGTISTHLPDDWRH